MKQEMMGWQWHQLDHMPLICTSLQRDNHAGISTHHSFLQADALPDAEPTVIIIRKFIMCTCSQALSMNRRRGQSNEGNDVCSGSEI